MARTSYSVIIIGGGIIGLSLGLRALDLGLRVEIISQDEVTATTSAMAAGMIAPALEAMNEPRPAKLYQELKAVQRHWYSFAHDLGLSALLSQALPAHYLWSQKTNPEINADVLLTRLADMGAKARLAEEAALSELGYERGFMAIQLEGEWLMEARGVLSYLRSIFLQRGGHWRSEGVATVAPQCVGLETGEVLRSEHIVIAAGFGSRAFASSVTCLERISPIKGHLIDIETKPSGGLSGRILRSPSGYYVFYADYAKFGATMEPGRADMSLETEAVVGLEVKARGLRPKSFDYHPHHDVLGLCGIRACSPDQRPMIGRDEETGLYIATAMRRNGWLFAPYAADLIVAQMGGLDLPLDHGLYQPNRDWNSEA